MAYGHVVPQDIRWMTEEMEKNGKDKPVILVTHYPLMDGDVDNWYEVTDAVRPYNVRLFIGGHYHSNRDLRYDGIPGVLMRSNLRDKEGKPGYGIYEVTKTPSVYTRNVSASLRSNGLPSRWPGNITTAMEKRRNIPTSRSTRNI